MPPWAALCAATLAASLPGLAPGASRVAVDAEALPWRGVVRVQTELGARCSGALIGPRLALTAAHCLFGRGTFRLVQPGSVHVLSGYAAGRFAGHARATALQIGPGFTLAPAAPPSADWALITLDAPIGDTRILPLSASPPPPGTPVMLGGYEQDRAEILMADTACTLIGPVRTPDGQTMLRHDCAATRGASGAPLLAQRPDGAWAVIGIASRATIGQAGGDAVPIAALSR